MFGRNWRSCDRFPPGVDASTDFDFSQPETAETPGFLLIDVNPGDGATAESIARLLSRGGQSLSGLAGVRNVLALEEQPFDRERDQPCLVACLGPAKGAAVDRERLVGEIRARSPRGEKAPPSGSATSPGPLGPCGPATPSTSRSSGRIAPALKRWPASSSRGCRKTGA